MVSHHNDDIDILENVWYKHVHLALCIPLARMAWVSYMVVVLFFLTRLKKSILVGMSLCLSLLNFRFTSGNGSELQNWNTLQVILPVIYWSFVQKIMGFSSQWHNHVFVPSSWLLGILAVGFIDIIVIKKSCLICRGVYYCHVSELDSPVSSQLLGMLSWDINPSIHQSSSQWSEWTWTVGD